MDGFVCKGCIGEGDDGDGVFEPGIGQGLTGSGDKEPQDVDDHTPVCHRGRLGVLVCPADDGNDVGEGDRDPKEPTNKREVRALGGVQGL